MASNCDVSKGKVSLECKNGVSGIKAIYIANYDDYDFVTESNEFSGHILTDLGTLDTVYKYALKNTANTFNQTIASSRDNGTTLYTQVANFVLTRINKDMEFQLKMLAWGRPFIFVELNTGQIILMGLEHGCEVAGSSGVGGTLDSLNGYTLNATATEKDPVYYLDEAAIAALTSSPILSPDNIGDETVISGPSTVAVASTIQLTASVSPRAYDAWVSMEASKATVSSTGLVTGVAAGIATIVYTDVSGATSSKEVTVTV